MNLPWHHRPALPVLFLVLSALLISGTPVIGVGVASAAPASDVAPATTTTTSVIDAVAPTSTTTAVSSPGASTTTLAPPALATTADSPSPTRWDIRLDPADPELATGLVLHLGLAAELVGFTWDGAESAHLSLRAFDGSSWSDWLQLEGEAQESPDAGSPEHRARTIVDPAWVGHDVTEVEVRLDEGHPLGLTLTAIDSEASPAELQITPSAITEPRFISRAEWGADESWRFLGNEGCTGTPLYAPALKMAIVHHSAGSNNYGPADSASLIRGIYYFHTHGQLWCDIAYNFLVDRYGQVFEGRYGGVSSTVIGGHTGGFNTATTGIALLGDFTSGGYTAEMDRSLVWLLSWKLVMHNLDPGGLTTFVSGDHESSRWPAGTSLILPTIVTHGDLNYTGCPGATVQARIDSIRGSVWNRVPRADADFYFGNPGDIPLVGDWDGNGTKTPAVYRSGWFYLRNDASSGVADLAFPYGNPGDIPVVGDWNGDGIDTVGIYRGDTFYLRNVNWFGFADVKVWYGQAGDQPIVGDWDGNGTSTVGVERADTYHLRMTNAPGPADVRFIYGATSDRPVIGDWNGDGSETVGVFRADQFYLRDSNSSGIADVRYGWGVPGDIPVPGDFNGDRVATGGSVRGGRWFLDLS